MVSSVPPNNDPTSLQTNENTTKKPRSKKLQAVSKLGSDTIKARANKKEMPQDVSNIPPVSRKGKALSKKVTQTIVAPPEPKKDSTRYYPTFITLLKPVPEGILGEVLPQISNDKKLAPYLSDILIELGCDTEKKIIEKSVQWLNTRPTKLGTLALVQQWPDEDASGKMDLLQFIHYFGQDQPKMESKFKEILSEAGTAVYDKLYAAHMELASA